MTAWKFLRANRKALGLILTGLLLTIYQLGWIENSTLLQFGTIIGSFTGVMMLDKTPK